ncbi:MAG: GNAT family N-acetyltransferase [Cyclobacteriaceae bacterium]|nr:GNAT family N-acetyltransferase [Cyclobacteriaceae bacterium]
MVRLATKEDAAAVSTIYNHYVENTTVTFEINPVAVEDMVARIAEILSKYPFLVYDTNNIIEGFAYASRWKGRCAYEYSAESTVYVKKDAVGRGIGKALYKELLFRLKEQGIHSVIGGISLPNEASIRLHEGFGFEKAGQFREVGRKLGKWIDVGYWELLFGNSQH